MKTRLTLAAAVLVTAATLAGCSDTTAGRAVCPGCGTQAEPDFPTPRESPGPPTGTPETPGPNAAPGDGATLPTDERGYVYIETKSGQTRCQLNSETVGCESQFENSPDIEGEPANGVSVTADGALSWVLGNLGNIPVVTLDYGSYSAAGWRIDADASGTRFTNEATGHGMVVAVEGVQSF